MEDKIIRCDLIVKEIKDEIKEFVSGLKNNNRRIPSLCIISVGNDSASESYIKGKVKDCEYTGIDVNVIKYDNMVTESELCKRIDGICKDSSIDGLIVQLPLPKHIDSKEVAKHIKKEYDVDGFTDENTALLWSKDTVKNKNNNGNTSNRTNQNTSTPSYVEEIDSGVKINKSTKLNEAKEISGYQITNIQLTTESGMTTLLADVTNNTGAKTEVQTVDITLLDNNGQELTTVTGIISELEAGATTQLNIAMTSDYINAYDFKVTIN